MTDQVYEVATDLHPSPFHSVAASWVATGQSLSLVFLSASEEETGLSLKLLPLVVFFVEVTGPSLNHAYFELSLPMVIDEHQGNVFYLMMSWAFFWWVMNLYFEPSLFSLTVV